jgi:uncharacterized membrane protein HdeD (DUF308 family)
MRRDTIGHQVISGLFYPFTSLSWVSYLRSRQENRTQFWKLFYIGCAGLTLGGLAFFFTAPWGYVVLGLGCLVYLIGLIKYLLHADDENVRICPRMDSH